MHPTRALVAMLLLPLLAMADDASFGIFSDVGSRTPSDQSSEASALNPWADAQTVQATPNLFCSPKEYLTRRPGVATAGIDVVQHFTQTGKSEGMCYPEQCTDSEYMRERPDVAAARMDAKTHFTRYGLNEGMCEPTGAPARIAEGSLNAQACTSDEYLAQRPDVKKAQMTALTHYNQYGKGEGMCIPAGGAAGSPFGQSEAFTMAPNQPIVFHSLRLVLQGDGNFVAYRANVPVWQTNTPTHDCGACTAALQADGNLVLYDKGVAYWESHTNGFSNPTLQLSETYPYLSIWSQGSKIWSSSCLVGQQVQNGTCVPWDGMINADQVIGAFARRHPNDAKKQTQFYASVPDYIDFNDLYKCERITTGGDIASVWIGKANHASTPGVGYTGAIYDWYVHAGGKIGFRGTFNELANVATLWNPLWPAAPDTFTSHFVSGSISTSGSWSTTAGPYQPNFTPQGSATDTVTLLGTDYINFGGNIGYRWVFGTNTDPLTQKYGATLEAVSYDLGPAPGVYDPEYGIVQYYQSKMAGDPNKDDFQFERFGLVVPATETYSNCHGSYFSYFSF